MRLSLRFLVPLLLALGVFAYAAVPLADALMQRWFVRDLDMRSTLIASTVREPLTALIASGSDPRITLFFNRMLQDERLYAVGLCYGGRAQPVATPLFPRNLDCATIENEDGGRHVIRSPNGLLHVAVRTLDGDEAALGWLALVHDMSFVERRSEETRQYLFYFFMALVRVDRAHHGDHRPALVARLGARAARAAARRRPAAPVVGRHGPGAAADRARPARADPRSRAPVPAARRQPADLGPGGAARHAAQRTARQRRHRRVEPRALHPRAHARGHRICSARRADSSPRSSR